jgi:hypothetical protein
VAVGVALRMSVGMVGVEVPACGRRGAGGADANLTKQARIDIASLGELWSFPLRDPDEYYVTISALNLA